MPAAFAWLSWRSSCQSCPPPTVTLPSAHTLRPPTTLSAHPPHTPPTHTHTYRCRSAEALLRAYLRDEAPPSGHGSAAVRLAAAATLFDESAAQVAEALALVVQLEGLYPGMSRALTTQRVAPVGGAAAQAVLGVGGRISPSCACGAA